MILFHTTPERYQVSDWGLWKEAVQVKSADELQVGDKVKMKVSFLNLMIDKECVLIIRAYSEDKLVGLKAQEVMIFPDVIPFDLVSEEFEIPKQKKIDKIELLLLKDFSTITEQEENQFLLGKYVEGCAFAVLNTDTAKFEKACESVSANPSPYIGNYEPCKKLFQDTVCFVQDGTGMWIKNAKYMAKQPVIRKEKRMLLPIQTAEDLFGRAFPQESGYIALRMLAECLGAYYYEDRFGLCVISSLPYDYSETMYTKRIQYMVRLLAYERPKAADLMKKFKARIRPRSLGYREEVERAVRLSKTNKEAEKISENLLKTADKFMERKVQYELDRSKEQAALATAIVDYDDMLALYWAYLTTGQQKYLIRLKEHVLAMAGMEHWYGDCFYLMTSRALVTLSMAYDFLYDEFTAAERERIAKAMVEKGFLPARKLYYGLEDEKKWPWCIRRTNWNFICNSGVIFAAGTLFGEYETELCADTLEKAIQSLEFACIWLSPDGELFEGLGYAAYTWNYLVFALQALETNFGSSFGLGDGPGAHLSYKVPFQLMSASGFFSQGDTGTTLRLGTQYVMWQARKFQDHTIPALRRKQVEAAGDSRMDRFTDLLWFDENANLDEGQLDYVSEAVWTAVSRSDWSGEGMVFCIHAGDNTLEHSHMDLGTFDLEAMGFRFASEMGIDSGIYCVPGSQYMLRGRNEYYAARAEGHNVYVINPDKSPGQRSLGCARIEIIKQSAEHVRYCVDMEPAYRGQVKSAKRYVELKENRSVFVVHDEIEPLKSGDRIYWFWHTFAEIFFRDPLAVEVTDENTVILEAEGKRLHVQFDATVPFTMRKGMSLPLDTSPAPFDQLQGGMIRQLLTVVFETTQEPLIFRATAWEEGKEYIPEDRKERKIR